MVHHLPSVGHRLAVGNRVSRRKLHRDFGTVHAHHAIFTDNGIGLHILRFFLGDFAAFHAFRHEFFQLVPLLAVHGFGDLKIGRLGFAPVLLQFHCHMPVKPVYINASHFKAEGQRLVVPCLFIAPFKGYADRPGEKRIPRAVNKCSGADRSQPCNRLDNTGLNDVTGTQRIYQHRLVEDFHPRLFAHLIIDQGQGFGVVPGLLRHTVKGFNAVLPQPILHFRHIGSIAVRRMGIHKGIHAAQYCQTAQRHAPLNEQRFGSVPGSHNRSSRPRRSAACYAHIHRIQHRDFLTCILYRTVSPACRRSQNGFRHAYGIHGQYAGCSQSCHLHEIATGNGNGEHFFHIRFPPDSVSMRCNTIFILILYCIFTSSFNP